MEINAENWQGGPIEVSIIGSESSGKPIGETFRVTPGEPKTIPSAKSGTYLFTVDQSGLTVNDTVYKADQLSVRYNFSKKNDLTVTIDLVVDEEATSALAAKKAAEEQTAAEAAAQKKQSGKKRGSTERYTLRLLAQNTIRADAAP